MSRYNRKKAILQQQQLEVVVIGCKSMLVSKEVADEIRRLRNCIYAARKILTPDWRQE